MWFRGGRREWALNMAFVLCMVFMYIMHSLTSFYVDPEKMLPAQVFNMAGCIAGALFLPFILPLGVLRAGRRPPQFSQRLVLLGFLFLPYIVLLFLGLNSWLTRPVNVAVRGITNGIIMALVHGLFISLGGKHRNLWAGVSISMGLFVFNLASTIQQRHQSPFTAPLLFYIAGLFMVIIAVFLYLYLSALPAHTPGGAEDSPDPSEPPESASVPSAMPLVLPLPLKKRFPSFLFPLLAAAVIFWTNSFTERLFMPLFHLPTGFNFTIVAIMLGLPVVGFLADRYRQRFFNVFILFSFGVFLVAPSLLLFNHSETIFLVLYTLNAISIQLIVVVFPFAILDLYWKESGLNGRGYWAWLLAISMNLLRISAGARIGLFRSIPVNNPYAVLLLSLVVIVYFVLSLKLVKFQTGALDSPAVPSNPITQLAAMEENFSIHGLSKREMEIAVLILQGQTNLEIAKRQYIEEVTVKKHINSIFGKYKVKRRAEFMAMFLIKQD
jgi:DNA-binding CsgD family transcriptional regulator